MSLGSPFDYLDQEREEGETSRALMAMGRSDGYVAVGDEIIKIILRPGLTSSQLAIAREIFERIEALHKAVLDEVTGKGKNESQRQH